MVTRRGCADSAASLAVRLCFTRIITKYEAMRTLRGRLENSKKLFGKAEPYAGRLAEPAKDNSCAFARDGKLGPP